jgi:hyperosmotically inducible periplasmic protein
MHMMNSNSTSKIVVGVGLAVVLGVGATVFTVRAKHDAQIAHTAAAPAALSAATNQPADATAPVQSASPQSPTDQPATPPSVPPAVAPVVAPSPVAQNAPTPSNVVNDDQSKPAKSKAKDRSDRHVAKSRDSSATADTRIASAGNSNASRTQDSASSTPGMKSDQAAAPAPSSTDMLAPAAVGASADTQQAAPQTGQEEAMSPSAAATSNDPVASDSQITADVKSQIATAAPNSNVDVTTTNGVVALAGSASSQDAVDQARQAAQRVAGVKHVDASALTVSSQ